MISLIVSALLAVVFPPTPQPTLPPLPALKGIIRATPAPPPLKIIVNVRSNGLCGAFKKSVLPVVGHALQNDRLIASSKPLFNDLTVKRRLNSDKASEDIDVLRLENLIRPLNDSVAAAKKILEDPNAFPKQAKTQQDKDLLAIRDSLRASVARQENVLDIISGFVDTTALGELQAAGHDYDKAIGAPDAGAQSRNNSTNGAPATPTPDPGLLTAGIGQNDPTRKADPAYRESGTLFGNDVYSAFAQTISAYQQEIGQHESVASELILKNVPACGGKVPAKP